MIPDSAFVGLGAAELEAAGITEPEGAPTDVWYDTAAQQLAATPAYATIARQARHQARWHHWSGDPEVAAKWQLLADEAATGAERNALLKGLLRVTMQRRGNA